MAAILVQWKGLWFELLRIGVIQRNFSTKLASGKHSVSTNTWIQVHSDRSILARHDVRPRWPDPNIRWQLILDRKNSNTNIRKEIWCLNGHHCRDEFKPTVSWTFKLWHSRPLIWRWWDPRPPCKLHWNNFRRFELQ